MGIIATKPCVESTTPLGAGATFTGITWNMENIYTSFGTHVFTNQAGTLYVEESHDGSTWRVVKTVSISASVSDDRVFVPTAPYIRVRYVNGGTAQTIFELTTVLMGGA